MPTRDPLVLRVASVRRATHSTRYVHLALGDTTFEYAAGQAVTLGVPDAPDRVPYSIASSPGESRTLGRLEFLIKIEPSGRWGQRFDRLVRGMRVSVEGPYGSFVLPDHPRERRYLFIAGGSGIAPIRSMIWHVQSLPHPPRMRLLYSARTPADFAYLSDLRSLVRAGHLELTLTATRECGERWRGERGRLTAERVAPLLDHPDTLCFVCGPAPMVEDVPRMLTNLGVARSRIRLEQW